MLLSRHMSWIVWLICLAGCQSQEEMPSGKGYIEEAPAGVFSPVQAFPQLQPFAELFSDLTEENLQGGVDEVYAENLYFNDTFHTVYRRSELKRYLIELAGSADTRIRLLDVSGQGNDLLVRWVMHIHTTVGWKTLDVESFGITHLRFDQSGKIVLHQDYWDGAEGFYAHLPVLGTMLRTIRDGMAE